MILCFLEEEEEEEEEDGDDDEEEDAPRFFATSGVGSDGVSIFFCGGSDAPRFFSTGRGAGSDGISKFFCGCVAMGVIVVIVVNTAKNEKMLAFGRSSGRGCRNWE